MIAGLHGCENAADAYGAMTSVYGASPCLPHTGANVGLIFLIGAGLLVAGVIVYGFWRSARG